MYSNVNKFFTSNFDDELDHGNDVLVELLCDDGLEQVSDVFHVIDDHLLAKVHLHQDMVSFKTLLNFASGFSFESNIISSMYVSC